MALPCLIFLGMLMLARLQPTGGQSIHRRIAVQFLSFSYVTGHLPNGDCCDGGQPLAMGRCAPDTCDTAFVFCLTHKSSRGCNPYVETTTVENNNTVSVFSKRFDSSNPNSTSSLIVIPITTMEDISVQVTVKEVDTQGTSAGVPLGNFSMVVNYTNHFTPHPDWQTYQFNNSYVRLGLNVTSFCNKYYYGPTCSVFCLKRRHYTCDNDGNKVCNPGYEGRDCNTITDLCVSTPCQNRGVCQKKVNDFSCTCTAGYTGKTCSSVVAVTSPGQSGHTTPQNPTGSASVSASSRTVPTTSVSPSVSASSIIVETTTALSSSVSTTSITETDGLSSTSLGVILGPLFSLLFLAAAGQFLFVWFQRKRKGTVQPEEQQTEKESTESREKENEGTVKPLKSTAPLATRTSNKASANAINMPHQA